MTDRAMQVLAGEMRHVANSHPEWSSEMRLLSTGALAIDELLTWKVEAEQELTRLRAMPRFFRRPERVDL